jgi:uncharacterized membrane protein HdeD (DUF308 family)
VDPEERKMSNTLDERKVLRRAGAALLIRGILAVLFGVLVIAWPAMTVLAIVFVFGVFALLDGAASLYHYFSRRQRASGWTLASGIVSILAGIVALVWPGITALWLALLIGAWALVLGITQIVVSVQARTVIGSWWAWLAAGIVLALFGLYVFFFPGAGILGLLGVVAAFAFATGILLLAAGFQLFRIVGWTQGPRPGAGGAEAFGA